MSKAPGSKNQHRPPDGRIRLSQLVTTFGPGAMVDLVHDAVLVGGLDYWRYDAKNPTPSIDEPRLRERVQAKVRALGITLSQDAPFRTGPPGDDDTAGPWIGIQVAEFPAWFICQRCRALSHRKSLEEKGDRYRHICSKTQTGDCVPVRFVTTCKDGHLDEFPWNWFVHRSGERCDGRDLFLYEGATGDFTEIVVHCKNCDSRRPLADAREDQVLLDCQGRRPWLGHQADETCTHKLHLLSRTASNAYFAQTVSALTIPEKGRELQGALSSAALWPLLGNAKSAGDVRTLRQLVSTVDSTLAAITGRPASDYSDEELFAAIQAIHGGQNAPREKNLLVPEFRQFLTAKDELPGELPPEHESFFASRLVPGAPLPACIEDITLVKKLRRVTAQVGFTRLGSPVFDPNGEDDKVKLGALTLAENWLPAMEILGEGVFLRFREDVVRAWEQRPAILEREGQLKQGFERVHGPSARFPGVRYYMLHSLSHLLMTAMSLECGYAAASLSERIYSARSTDPVPMAAILVLTGSSGAEGTLGGLIEQGRRLDHHLRRAFRMGTLCSNDPVCASHLPGDHDHSERHLEGAACHGCLYIAEPSCERFNGYLDRSLVVPTLGKPRELAFFEDCP